MATKPAVEAPEDATRHCLGSKPYRMIVFDRMNRATPLYRVAGSDKAAMGAANALKEAFRVHGGLCFYCRGKIPTDALSIDHVETVRAGDHLQNLVIACRRCNAAKGDARIEAFHPDAGREWLTALHRQVEERLGRL